MAKILIDEPIEDGKLGFDRYATSLVDIIMGTKPQFTIGIFGDWGTGKTTLMRMMYKKLQGEDYKEKVVPVWFNAWLYEYEHHLAVVPLLNTLIVELSKNSELKKVMDTIDEVRLSFIKKHLKGVKFNLGIVEYNLGDVLNEANKLKKTSESDSIYYNEFKYIEKALNGVNENKDLRIVVFIDDLDRCAPDKVLEIFESIKIFLGMKCFIYVLGMSYEVIEKCIREKYEDLGIEGKDYIKKIIQIPFRIPEWQDPELEEYFESITKALGDPEKDLKDPANLYSKLFSESKELVIKGIEKNPREVKRFINSYIVTQEVFRKEELDDKILLPLQIFQFRWKDFYDKIFRFKNDNDFKDFCTELLKSIEDPKYESPKYKEFITKPVGIKEFLMEKKVKKLFEDLLELPFKDLHKYRRAGMALGKDVIEDGKEEFRNPEDVKKAIYEKKDLSGKNLSILDLTGLPFKGMKLIKTNLSGAILSKADLTLADLSGADLSYAELDETNLDGTNLKDADLIGVRYLSKVINLPKAKNLSILPLLRRETNLSGMKLRGVDFSNELINIDISNVDLSGANLSNADFDGAILNGVILKGANLTGAKNLFKAENFSPSKDLTGIILSGTDLSGMDLSERDLRRANFSDANLFHAKLSGSNLEDANFRGATFIGTDLSNARNIQKAKDIFDTQNLSEIKLSELDFSGLRIDLSGKNLEYAVLEKANFSEAKLSNANLSKANLSGAKFIDANLSGAILSFANLKDTDLSGAILIGIQAKQIEDLNEKTKAKRIILVNAEDNKDEANIKKEIIYTLDDMDEKLKDIILRDNRDLNDIYNDSE